jgi:hypothetical protein
MMLDESMEGCGKRRHFRAEHIVFDLKLDIRAALDRSSTEEEPFAKNE